MATAQSRNSAVKTLPLRRMALPPLPSFPLVSILISNYNYSFFLGAAIVSSLGQTYQNLEVIVCDDGSTDNSREILEHYRSLDSRVRPIYQTNGGQSAALNAAFAASAGEIISLLDADDVFLPDKLQLVVKAFAAAPDAGFAVNRMLLVDGARKYQADIPSLFELASGWRGESFNSSGPQILPGLPPTSGISLRRSVAQTIFPLPAGLKAYSDTLIQALAPMMTPIVAIETPVSEYRVHGGNVGGVSRFTTERLRNLATYEQEIWRAWRRIVVSLCLGSTTDVPLPSEEMIGTLMGYAYARFRSNPNFKAVYHAIPSAYLHALPRLQQWFWRTSLVMPGWLFRRFFDFAYGHTRTKMMVRRTLKVCRRSLAFRNWIRKFGAGKKHVESLRGRRPASQAAESFVRNGIFP